MLRIKTGAMLILVVVCSASAQEWNQWRGPNRDGVTATFSPPKAWPQTLAQKWKVTVGSGYSSPVVSGSRVYVHTRREDQEAVSAILAA